MDEKIQANVIIPLIRKVIPSTIAADILGVQPMDTRFFSSKGVITCREQHSDSWMGPAYVAEFGVTLELLFGQTNTHNEATEWCTATFGPSAGGRWYNDELSFFFRDAADRTLFVLKWQ